MKQIISLIVFLMAACIGMSQGLVVESFNLDPFDATATSKENEVLDFNRIPCALLKVMIIDNTVNFKSDYIVRYNPRGKNEYWVYMSEGARSLIVRSDNFLPQEVVFAKYAPEIKELKRGRTYVLTLSCKGESKDDRVAVTFVCNSPTAAFVIDNYQTEHGIRTFRMEPGDHTVEVTAEGYKKLTTTIRVSPYMKKQEISLDLTPDKSLDKIVAEGDKLFGEKKYIQAIGKYLQASELGNPHSQNKLGEMYYYGYGVWEDHAEAVKWFRQAAEQGHAGGQNNLGEMYYHGEGVEMDYAEAVKWYRRSAEQGYASGQVNLGYMYQYGYGVEKDYAEAVKWYRRSAEQGYLFSQNNLGDMYEYGKGVEKDCKKALYWYGKAAEQGDPDAIRRKAILEKTCK